MGATVKDDKRKCVVLVSTHAPVMGATPAAGGLYVTLGVSTHAPVMGATLDAEYMASAMASFQPTRP